MSEHQVLDADRRLEALLLESLDDPRPDLEITPQFFEDVKAGFLERLERHGRSLRRK